MILYNSNNKALFTNESGAYYDFLVSNLIFVLLRLVNQKRYKCNFSTALGHYTTIVCVCTLFDRKRLDFFAGLCKALRLSSLCTIWFRCHSMKSMTFLFQGSNCLDFLPDGFAQLFIRLEDGFNFEPPPKLLLPRPDPHRHCCYWRLQLLQQLRLSQRPQGACGICECTGR